jgi:hypothetical protein
MSKNRTNKTTLLSLWVASAVIASFALAVPSMAFASNYGEKEDESYSSGASEGTGSSNNGGDIVDTQTYENTKTKTTTTDIHKQITKKEIVGTKTTITTKVAEDENGDTGEDAIAAAEAKGSSTGGGDCECSTAANGDSEQSEDHGEDSESGEEEEY